VFLGGLRLVEVAEASDLADLGVPKLNLASSLSSDLTLLSRGFLDDFFSFFPCNLDVLRVLPAFSGGMRVILP
jgi:hypothetical protein